jgi:membrane protease YdiL (CAAX protease family)
MSPAARELLLWTGAGAAVLGVGVAGVVRAGRRGRPFGLPRQRLRAAPWNGLACLGAFLVLWAPQQLAVQWLPDNRPAQLAVGVAALPVQLLTLWLALRSAFGNAPYPGGQTRHRLRDHAVAGFGTWLVVVPATLAVHAVVRAVWVQFGEPAMSDHPLIQALQRTPNDATLWSMITLEAVIGAPVREEVFFRGVVQPWAILRPWSGDLLVGVAAVGGYLFAASQSDSLWHGALAPLFVAVVWLVIVCAARRRPGWLERVLPRMTPQDLPREQVVRGIAGTSILFAMTHAGSWPDPVPLTVLSLGLGWLAFRTQSLVGPIACHALFNALTMYELRIMTLWAGGSGTG